MGGIDLRQIGGAAALAYAVGLGAASLPPCAHAQDVDPHSFAPRLVEILPPRAKSIWFTHAYDAKHLRDHPKQRVENIVFWLRLVKLDPGAIILLRPNEPRGIRMTVGCGGGTDTHLVPGDDDKVFRLAKTATRLCRAIARKARVE